MRLPFSEMALLRLKQGRRRCQEFASGLVEFEYLLDIYVEIWSGQLALCVWRSRDVSESATDGSEDWLSSPGE